MPKSSLRQRRTEGNSRVHFGRPSSVRKDGQPSTAASRSVTTIARSSLASSDASASAADDGEEDSVEEVEEVEYIVDDDGDEVSVTCQRTEIAHDILEHQEATYIEMMLSVYASEKAKGPRPEDTLGRRGIRPCCYWVANHILFRTVFTALLIANITLLAIEADDRIALVMFREDPAAANQREGLFWVSENIFTALFTLEITLRIVGSPVRPWKDGWLMSDTIIVGMSIVDVWILAVLQSTTGIFSSFGSFRAIRMFRAFRVLRILRILQYIRPLRLVAEALGEAFKSILCTITLTFVVTWSAAVVITSSIGNVFAGSGAEYEYDSFSFSVLMLNLIMLRGVPWGQYVVEPMLFSSDVRAISAGVVMIVAILAIALGFMNIIIGVFTTTLLEAANKDTVFMSYKSLTRGEFSVDEMKRVYSKLDKDMADCVTPRQFAEGIEEHKLACAKIGLMKAKAPALYRIMDLNRSGAVSLEKFLLGCIKARWTSNCVDTLCLDHTQNKIFREAYKLGMAFDHDFTLTTKCLCEVESNLENLKVSVKHLLEELNYRGKRELPASIVERDPVLGPKSECDQVIDDLEGRFSFMTRLVELKETVRRKGRAKDQHFEEGLVASGGRASALRRSSRADDSERAGGPDGAGGGGVASGAAPSPMEEMWSEIVFQEALPWIRSHLTSEKLPLTTLTRRGSGFSARTSTWAEFLSAGATKVPAPAGATADVAPHPPNLPRPPPSLAAAERPPPSAPRDVREGSGLRPSLLTPAASVWYDEIAKVVRRDNI